MTLSYEQVFFSVLHMNMNCAIFFHCCSPPAYIYEVFLNSGAVLQVTVIVL